MKIAVYHNTPSGGAKRAIYEMVRGLSGRGHSLWEFCTSTSKADGEFLPLAPFCAGSTVLDLHTLPRVMRWIPLLTPYLNLGVLWTNFRRTDRVNREAAKLIDSMKFDMVFAHDCAITENPYLLQYLHTPNVFYCHHGAGQAILPYPVKRSKIAGKQIFARVKGLFYALAYSLSRHLRMWTAGKNARFADQIWVNSYFARESLRAVYAVESSVMQYGVDVDKFRPLDIEKEGYLLAVGALHPWKGYEFMIESVGLLPENLRPPLVIAANSSEAQYRATLMELAERCGVQLTIRQILDDEDMVRTYNRALAVLFTPVMEPFGLVALEAQACGTPVVAVREGGLRENVLDAKTGLLIDRSPIAFARAVQRIMSDERLQRQLGQSAIDYVQSQWSWERTIDRVEIGLTELAD
jgi:glycosyltransferase involved in cell wall biosynthesis